MKTSKILISVVIGLSLLSCNESEKIDDERILHVMKNAKENQLIGANTFVLEAYIWRDFMPMMPDDDYNRGMRSVNWLVSTDSTPIPDNINMVKQYIIHKNKVWEAGYEDEPYPLFPDRIMRISRNGPEWETGISVTVFSQIYDSETKTSFYLKCNDVLIHRTD